MWHQYAVEVFTVLHDLVVSRQERAALRAFRSQNPSVTESWSSLVSDERDRFVVCVFYGRCQPARYRFYAVSRDLKEVSELDDDRPYRPRGWR